MSENSENVSVESRQRSREELLQEWKKKREKQLNKKVVNERIKVAQKLKLEKEKKILVSKPSKMKIHSVVDKTDPKPAKPKKKALKPLEAQTSPGNTQEKVKYFENLHQSSQMSTQLTMEEKLRQWKLQKEKEEKEGNSTGKSKGAKTPNAKKISLQRQSFVSFDTNKLKEKMNEISKVKNVKIARNKFDQILQNEKEFPNVSKLAMYWIQRAKFEEKRADIAEVIRIFEEALKNSAKPAMELEQGLRNILRNIQKSSSRKPLGEREKLQVEKIVHKVHLEHEQERMSMMGEAILGNDLKEFSDETIEQEGNELDSTEHHDSLEENTSTSREDSCATELDEKANEEQTPNESIDRRESSEESLEDSLETEKGESPETLTNNEASPVSIESDIISESLDKADSNTVEVRENAFENSKGEQESKQLESPQTPPPYLQEFSEALSSVTIPEVNDEPSIQSLSPEISAIPERVVKVIPKSTPRSFRRISIMNSPRINTTPIKGKPKRVARKACDPAPGKPNRVQFEGLSEEEEPVIEVITNQEENFEPKEISCALFEANPAKESTEQEKEDDLSKYLFQSEKEEESISESASQEEMPKVEEPESTLEEGPDSIEIITEDTPKPKSANRRKISFVPHPMYSPTAGRYDALISLPRSNKKKTPSNRRKSEFSQLLEPSDPSLLEEEDSPVHLTIVRRSSRIGNTPRKWNMNPSTPVSFTPNKHVIRPSRDVTEEVEHWGKYFNPNQQIRNLFGFPN